MRAAANSIRVSVLPHGRTIRATGRDAWALSELIKAGPKGCTAIENPGPRWSSYVFELKKLGLDIETVHEKHSGPFPGTHARYVLRSVVTVVEEVKLAA